MLEFVPNLCGTKTPGVEVEKLKIETEIEVDVANRRRKKCVACVGEAALVLFVPTASTKTSEKESTTKLTPRIESELK